MKLGLVKQMSLLNPFFFISLLVLLFPKYSSLSIDNNPEQQRKRIAIIGGGIGGSFTFRYLTEFDSKCEYISKITIFEESAISKPLHYKIKKTSIIGENQNHSTKQQGGRVASVAISNGQIVEVGASIIHDENLLVTEMIEADTLTNIQKVKPFQSGFVDEANQIQAQKPASVDANSGIGIWNGKKWEINVNHKTFKYPILQKIYFFWRYNMDYIKLKSCANAALNSFTQIYKLLNNNSSQSLTKTIQSPNDLWKAVGLYNYTLSSFDSLLDKLGLSQSSHNLVPRWRNYLPKQGILREELAMSMNLCNYHQTNSQLNGLVGLISFLPSGGDLFSIEGGNGKLIHSAFRQGQSKRQGSCVNSKEEQLHIQKRVDKVVYQPYDLDSFELFHENESLGIFDIIILAAPLQFANITFLTKKINSTSSAYNSFSTFEFNNAPKKLPLSATKQYTQVVTTIVSNVQDLHVYFSTPKNQMPKSICTTAQAAKSIDLFTCMTQITPTIYKMFTSTVPTPKFLQGLFGSNITVEYQKIWHQGAYPDYHQDDYIKKNTLPFLLHSYDNSAFYYVNTIEASASAIEISAIGAKIVSRLIFERFMTDKQYFKDATTTTTNGDSKKKDEL